MFEDAGFTEVTIRYRGLPRPYESALVLSCRKTGSPSRNAAADVGDRRALVGRAAPA
jgi:hypothetical protein